MKSLNLFLFLFIFFASFAYSSNAHSKTYYVKSFRAKIKVKPKAYSKAKGCLLKNKKITTINNKGFLNGYLKFKMKKSNKYVYINIQDLISKPEYKSNLISVNKLMVNAFTPTSNVKGFGSEDDENTGVKGFGSEDDENTGVKGFGSEDDENTGVKGLTNKKKIVNNRKKRLKQGYLRLMNFEKKVYEKYPENKYATFRKKGKVGEYKE
jgi:hypothetical protein